MEQLEERLAHKVRRYQHCYDVREKDHKNHEGTARWWREIGSALEEDPDRCREEWKQLRDRFVRLKKRMKTKSRDPGSVYRIMLSWLEGFIKNWETQVTFNGVAAEGLLAFEEVAVRFTDEEWTLLDAGQQALYQEVMAENYGMVASLIQELQAEINAEDQQAGAADSSEQETGDGEGRSRLLFQLPTESEAKSWRRLERSPAAGPKQECRCSWRTMGFSSASLEFSMREFQKVWKAGAGEEDALWTRIGFSGERPLDFADSADVKEELSPEEESLNGETQGRLEEKLRRPLVDISYSTPMQETSGRVKILHWMETSPEGVFLGKAYLGPGLGSSNSTLDFKDGFWLEKPKQTNHHGTLLERALGKLIQGPDTQEGLETKQEVDSLMEVKHDLALFHEEAPTDGSTRTHQGRDASFDRSRNRQQRASCSENRNAPMESERIYKCSYCGRCFEKSFDLVTHERAHIGEKIYRCFHCEKRFSHRIDFLTHKRNHPGEKPHQCELDCAKCHGQTIFPEPPHGAPPGEKACQCPVCGERFRWKSNLIRHRRVHTGEKPYRCADCEKSYTRKTALDRHKRTHVGEKVCEIGAPSLGPTSVLVLLV